MGCTLDRGGGGNCDGNEQTEETGRVRKQLSRNSVLRSGGDGELDSCRRWRADARAGGAVEHLWMFVVARREMVDRGRWELRDLVRCNRKRSETPAGTQILHDIIIVERASPNNGTVTHRSRENGYGGGS